jgi:hypothetical protein
MGALSMGPKDKPSTYVVRGKVATTSETLKSNITSGIPGAYIELPKALMRRIVSTIRAKCCEHTYTTKQMNDGTAIFKNFFFVDQFNGRDTSS